MHLRTNPSERKPGDDHGSVKNLMSEEIRCAWISDPKSQWNYKCCHSELLVFKYYIVIDI